MNLLRLLQSLGNKPLGRLISGAGASALSTTIVLAVVTFAAQKINDSKQEFVDLRVAGLFVAVVLLYVVCESWMIAKLAADVEEAIDRLRMQLIDRLRHADLWQLEHFGQSRLFGSITQSCKIISSNSQYLAPAMRSVVLIATILIYIAFVSMVSFLLLTVLLSAAAAAYYRLGRSLEQSQEELADHEATLFECVSDLFDGFKEQRLCSARSRALGTAFSGLSADTVTARNQVHLQSWQQFVFPATAGEQPFRLGPLDLSIRRGEVIFITGGNGSGKSTLIKLLTGLYQPGRGHLTIDGLKISPSRLASYRALMAPVFSDFHLFSRLYGLGEIDRLAADDLLRWLEMTHVAGITDDRFSRIDLSTGQRKRLALVAAVLEAKPVLILDEWAADQDPHFRRIFYEELLPDLKARGKIVICVTHDDRWFHLADRMYRMDEGRIEEVHGT